MATHSLLLHVRQDVGVGVQGDRNVWVPENLLDYLGVDTLQEEEGGDRMPKIMEAQAPR